MATETSDAIDPQVLSQQLKVNKFKTAALDRLSKLQSDGISYRRIVHNIDNVLTKYILDMNEKNKHLGNRNLELLGIAVKSIFQNVNINCQYDVIEYVHCVMDWYFKCLGFKYNLIKKQPMLPDFTIAEIIDLSKNISSS